MEKRTLMEHMKPRQHITISAQRWWLIVVSIVMVAVFYRVDTRITLRADLAHATWAAGPAAQESHRPFRPLGPYTVYTVLLSAVVGLVFSGSTRYALDLMALGSIPNTDEDDYPSKLVVCKFPHSPVAEAYRVLHTNLEPQATGYPLQVLIVTSSAPLEGKSVAAANLAAAIAQSGQRVILVDADLRHPIQQLIFELENHVGLAEALQGDTNLAEALQSVPVNNLRILPSGSSTDNPSELADPKRLRGLIESLRQQADVVIVDSLPVATLPDAKMLAVRLGGTLLVIDSTRAPRGFVQRGKQALDKFGARLSGAALDQSPASSEDYCYYRYYCDRGEGAALSPLDLPLQPPPHADLMSEARSPAAFGSPDQVHPLDTRHFARPPALDLLKARAASVTRHVEARNTLIAVLLGAAALVILTIVFISSFSKQQEQKTVREATRAVAMAQTVSAETSKADQTATAVAKEKDLARLQTEVAQTQAALIETAAAGAAATQQAMYAAGQRPAAIECDTVELDVLQSPTRIQSAAATIANVELTWRVRNRATSPICRWGQAGQETKLLRAVEISGQPAPDVPVKLRWIQDDDYDLSLSVSLGPGQHDLVWRLIPPAARSPRGPDLLARVVVITPTATPQISFTPAPPICPIETYPCNCRKECDPRSGCQRVCEICTRPKCE